MSRLGWTIFLGVQATGEICSWTARHFLSALGPTLWLAGSALLLPGDIGAAFLVDKVLLHSGLTMAHLTMLQVPLELAINTVVWLLCFKLYTFFRGRRSSASGAPHTADSNLSHHSP
jgi:hypothetical protein